MWGSSDTQTEEVEGDLPDFSNMSDVSFTDVKKDEPIILIDANGDIWLAVYDGEKLKITPAEVTPKKDNG